MNVYAHCPDFEDDRFLLRLIRAQDCADLLKVYSDERAVPLFNGDGCNGDDFHYQTMERMRQATAFWIDAYKNGWFVRWTVLDQSSGEAIGTVELCARASKDAFDGCGVFRLDLRSDYENADALDRILGLVVPPAYDLLGAERLITKAVVSAKTRRAALVRAGFALSGEKLIGSDGTAYGDYFVAPRPARQM